MKKALIKVVVAATVIVAAEKVLCSCKHPSQIKIVIDASRYSPIGQETDLKIPI